MGAAIQEGGGEPVHVAVDGAVVAGHGHGCGDDADFHAADDRGERPVGQLPQHRRAAVGVQPDQELRPGGVHRGQEVPAAGPPVHDQQHGRVQQRQQLQGLPGLPAGRRAEDRPQQRPGARLHQRHQRQGGVAGLAVARVLLARPFPVRRRVGHPDGLAAVEGDRPVAAEHDRGRPRLTQRPGQDPGQPLHRPGPDPAAQVPQRLRRRVRDPGHPQPRRQLPPDPQVAGLREQAHRQQEIQPAPGRQQPDPPLQPAFLLQHGIGQLERDDPGQLAQVTGSEHARGNGDHRHDRRHGTAHGRLNGQRRSPVHAGVWPAPVLPGLRCQTRPNRQTRRTA